MFKIKKFTNVTKLQIHQHTLAQNTLKEIFDSNFIYLNQFTFNCFLLLYFRHNSVS